VVLKSDLYAVAALAGAAIVAGGRMLHIPAVLAAICGGLTCFGLRMMAIYRGWRLPVARGERAPPS
jgi:uncharacterized membrane protein YeiH